MPINKQENKSKQLREQISEEAEIDKEAGKIYSPLGCNCYWEMNLDGSDWHGEVCVEHVEEMIAQNRKAILEEVRSLIDKESGYIRTADSTFVIVKNGTFIHRKQLLEKLSILEGEK